MSALEKNGFIQKQNVWVVVVEDKEQKEMEDSVEAVDLSDNSKTLSKHRWNWLGKKQLKCICSE